MKAKHILFCNCSYANIIPDETRKVVFDALCPDRRVVVVDDLCKLAAKKDPLLGELVKQKELTVVACYPRAVRWLFNAGGATLEEGQLICHNMRATSAEEIVARVAPLPDGEPAELQSAASEWVPWFPTIDYSRCSNCKQCRDFCLFGVYELDNEGTVVVANPANCKNNCPACARVCPNAAIIFPKVAESPINGGEINDEESVRAKIRLNVDEILGSDVYAALAERQKKAKKRLLNRKQLEQALAERKRCSVCDEKNGVRPCSSK